MADITVTTTPGEPIEGIAIANDADTGLTELTITFSTTSTFTTKESVIRALTNILARLEGYSFPPADFTP